MEKEKDQNWLYDLLAVPISDDAIRNYATTEYGGKVVEQNSFIGGASWMRQIFLDALSSIGENDRGKKLVFWKVKMLLIEYISKHDRFPELMKQESIDLIAMHIEALSHSIGAIEMCYLKTKYK